MFTNIVPMLNFAESRERTLNAGEYLFHLGERVCALFVVLEGEIHMKRHQEDGGMIVLQRARSGEVLAEASLFSSRYHCDAIASKDSRVRCVPKRQLVDRFRKDPNFAEAWAKHLAWEIQNTRLRSEVLSRRTVASRLDAWLAWYGDAVPRGEWKHLAYQIGVSPEALYRELTRRRNSPE